MKAQEDSIINVIRGKNIVGKATKEEILLLFEHIDALEMFLDKADCEDMFGTEGWKHNIGLE